MGSFSGGGAVESRETFLRELPLPFELKEGFYGLGRGKQILAREEILCFGRHFLLEGLRYKLCNLFISPHSLFFLRLLLFSLTLCCLGWILEATRLFVER